MSTLVLEIKPGELMIVNGAPIRFRTRSRIELAGKARFLFGKQILAPAEANTPARRIYFALQTAYVGTEAERAPALNSAREFAEAFKAATTSALAREILDQAMALAQADSFYDALKLARRIIRHETAIFQNNEAIEVAPATLPATSIFELDETNEAASNNNACHGQ